MEATCRVCKQLADISDYRIRAHDLICRPCCAARARAYREKNGRPPEPRTDATRKAEAARWRLRKDDPAEWPKIRARLRLQRQISRGKLKRQPCEVCSATPAEAHHDDYSRPLDVRWLCPTHHREHHRKVL